MGIRDRVINVIDSRYRSGRPLIVTTNLTLDDLRNPEDTAHSRIYDRLLSMCVPVRFTGDNFRQETLSALTEPEQTAARFLFLSLIHIYPL